MYKIIVSVLLCAGLFLIFNITPSSLFSGFENLYKYSQQYNADKLKKKKLSLKKQADIAVGNKKTSFIRRNFNDVKSMMEYSTQGFTISKVYFISAVLSIGGIVFGFAVNNIFLVPVLAVGMAMLPVWIIKLRESSYKKQLNGIMETALSGITTSYMRNNNIVLAVEENMKHITYPLLPVFSTFVNENKLLNANVSYGLRKMKAQINNTTFGEWCDAMIQCQSDHSLKVTLFPIINKFSEMKNIQTELDTTMMIPFQQFITMAIVVAMGLPIMKFINNDWYEIMVTTLPGKFIIAVTVLSIFAGMNKAVALCRPVEYKR